jgi:TM2 domain-containing membrane protein YozV
MSSLLMGEISERRKHVMKFFSYLFLYWSVIIIIYLAFRYYISEAEANFMIVGIILTMPITLTVKILEKYMKNRTIKKLY